MCSKINRFYCSISSCDVFNRNILSSISHSVALIEIDVFPDDCNQQMYENKEKIIIHQLTAIIRFDVVLSCYLLLEIEDKPDVFVEIHAAPVWDLLEIRRFFVDQKLDKLDVGSVGHQNFGEV